MKKNILYLFLATLVFAGVYAATNKISRTGQNIMLVVGGTTTTNGKGVIVSEDTNTNEYSLAVITAAIGTTSTATAYTNAFSPVYLATPTAYKGMLTGATGTQQTNLWSVGVIMTTSNIVVTGLSSNSTVGVATIPILVHGYKRTGQFE